MSRYPATRRPPSHMVRNLAGQVVGRVEVQEFVGSSSAGTRWSCLCDCGEVFVAFTVNLQNAGPLFACPKCRPRARRGVRPAVVKRNVGPKGKRCRVCEGQSWRRDGIKCSGCGERFAHETARPVTEFLVQQPVREL